VASLTELYVFQIIAATITRPKPNNVYFNGFDMDIFMWRGTFLFN